MEADDITCYPWDLEGFDPLPLPPIPAWSLPKLEGALLTEKEEIEETRLIQVAVVGEYIFGLTNKGHVLRYGRLRNEETYLQGWWEYVSIRSLVLVRFI